MRTASSPLVLALLMLHCETNAVNKLVNSKRGQGGVQSVWLGTILKRIDRRPAHAVVAANVT